MDKAIVSKRDLKETPLMCPIYLTKNMQWDSHWLMDKYPSRFEGEYTREILQDDQYDPALYPDEEAHI